MGQFDKSTSDFINAVSGGVKDPEEKSKKIKDVLGSSLKAVRGITTGGPVAFGLRAALGIGTKNLMEKEGKMSVVNVFNYLNSKYGAEWHDWEPETIWKTLLDDDGIDATAEIKNVIQAFQVIATTNQAHEDWQAFENVGHAINMNVVNFSEVQPLEVNEAAFAVHVINLIRPKKVEEDKVYDKFHEDNRPDHGFEKEIWGYIAASAKEAGLVLLPRELFGGSESPQNFLDRLNYGHTIPLKLKVSEIWPKEPSKDDPLEVKIQLGRLKEIKEYIEENHG